MLLIGLLGFFVLARAQASSGLQIVPGATWTAVRLMYVHNEKLKLPRQTRVRTSRPTAPASSASGHGTTWSAKTRPAGPPSSMSTATLQRTWSSGRTRARCFRAVAAVISARGAWSSAQRCCTTRAPNDSCCTCILTVEITKRPRSVLPSATACAGSIRICAVSARWAGRAEIWACSRMTTGRRTCCRKM